MPYPPPTSAPPAVDFNNPDYMAYLKKLWGIGTPGALTNPNAPGYGSPTVTGAPSGVTNPPPSDPLTPPPGGYLPMGGFDSSRTATDQDPKYAFQRTVQNLGFQNSAPTDQNLQSILDSLLGQGYKATRSGDVFSFDTGNKYGQDMPQDVARNFGGGADSSWQFINAGGGGAPAAGGGTPQAPQDYVNAALQSGISQSSIDSFLQSNPGDYGRLSSALGTGGGTGGGTRQTYPWSATIGGTNAGQLPGSDFSDPATNFLSNLINTQLGTLLQPLKNPAADQYAQLIQKLTDTLSQPAPMNEDLASYLKYARETFSNLQQEPFSGQDRAIINSQQIEPIEQDRTAAKQLLAAQLSARGLTPDSGIFQAAMQQLDQSYNGLRAEAYRGTSLAAIQQRYANQNTALGLGESLQGLNQYQDQLALQRQSQGVAAAGGLANLSNSLYSQEQGRQNQALALAQILAQLPVQRLSDVNAVASGGQVAGSQLTNSLLNLLGIQNQQSQYQQQMSLAQQQALWTSLGNIVGAIT